MAGRGFIAYNAASPRRGLAATDMPSRVIAQVTPEMLRWAREQAGCDLEQAGKSVGKDAASVAAWESADSGQRPTIRQAQKLADAYHAPLALFYLSQPSPDLERETVPEFRGLDPATGTIRRQSRQLRWMIRQAQERQAFIAELLENGGQAPLEWVGSAPPDADPELLGGRMREALPANGPAPQSSDKERLLDWWIERAEALGAFVSRYRPDGNPYWAVEPSEARGLSLCHPLAPYIVLNSRDAPARRIFTLLHELSHLYYGQCGVDDLADEGWMPDNARLLEQRCNRAAAAALMPAADFRAQWPKAGEDLPDKVRRLADAFGVSRSAIAVRARSEAMRFISETQYNELRLSWDEEYREFRESRSSTSSKGGGMPTASRVLKEFGGRYTGLLFDAYAQGQLSRLDLAETLGAKFKDIEAIRHRLESG